LFFDKRKRLTPQAYKRLRTILEATELGSGFSIAMRDLEIRGAGNLLGVRQSGHIAALGFDLYCQLLAEAVEELKASSSNLSPEGRGIGEGDTKKGLIVGEETCSPNKFFGRREESPSISLPLDAHIPEGYVSNLNTRLSLYHRLARVEHIEEVEEAAREFKDRFGPLPEPVENLLYIVKIKVLATRAKVSSISTQGRQIVIKPQEAVIASRSCEPKAWQEAKQSPVKGYDGAIKIGATQIKLDARLLGDKWKVVLVEILSSNCV
jgi:transcription-repair coupling factor (superfamily II helicase)